LKYQLPCPHCSSSDAYSISERADGSQFGYCFSCKGYEDLNKSAKQTLTLAELAQEQDTDLMDNYNYTYQYVPWRGISKETMEAFGVYTKVNSEGAPISIGFPYSKETIKVRSIAEKNFHSIGDMKNATLFGKDKFPAGCARSITITEGELDALSVYQMLGSAYPVVSVRSSSSGESDCKKERDYLNSFDRIYLCLDGDARGQEAKARIARLFDFNKVYDVKLSDYKDANAYLEAGKTEQFKRIWWNSKRFLPEGILSSFAEFDKIIDEDKKEASATYPFPTVQTLTYGIRTGEVILITAPEGIGKTEVIRAIEAHLLKTTESNLGIIHLEEDKARNLKGLAGYQLGVPCHLPDSQATGQDIKGALRKLATRDERIHIYNHFGSDDPDIILDTIRFLATSCDCKYVFLDHITMVVSGLADEDERKALDYISTRLAMMVKELDFALFLVSHVNDEGKTRGSRNISKIADCWIHLDRDKSAPTEEQRNTTHLSFNKNRFGARTGPGGKLFFDLSTFMITEPDSQHMNLPPLETTRNE
jgi:twinkle protein